jgi:hypothetical protein
MENNKDTLLGQLYNEYCYFLLHIANEILHDQKLCQHRFRIPQFPQREIPHPGIKLFSFYHPPY